MEHLTIHEEPTAPDWINNLNNDCLIKIFKYLPLDQRLALETVCKRWNEVGKLAWDDITELNVNGDWKSRKDSAGLPWTGCDKYTQCIGNILMRCGLYLKQLKLGSSCYSKLLPIVGQHCCNLERLTIDSDNFDENCIKLLPDMQRLTYLEMKKLSFSFPNDFFQTLPYGSLTELHLWGTSLALHLAHEFLRALENLEKLAALTLDEFVLEPGVIEAISQKPNLTFLSLANSRINFQVQILENIKNLKSLNLSHMYTMDRYSLENLHKLSQLEELIMNDLYGVTDQMVRRMHNLRKLECKDCSEIGNEGIIELMRCAPNLEYLDLVSTSISEAVLTKAAEITKRRTNNLGLLVKVGSSVKERWGFDRNPSPLLTVEDEDDYDHFAGLDEQMSSRDTDFPI